MSRDNEPIENEWYELPDRGQAFCVVSADEDEDIIEIQYEDGTTEELDFEAWEELSPETTEAPTDWAGAYDELDEEDEEYMRREEEAEEEEWSEPYDEE
ncbi:MAG TPA: DUF6763 family protein [Desulfurivibrionaceae bacterium]|nr:DUF6763 family protein [Desulfurivibrionaceae bacterium]